MRNLYKWSISFCTKNIPYCLITAYMLAYHAAGAQQHSDYIITTTHDTLYGNVKEYGILGKHDLSIKRANSPKIFFDFDQVTEWKCSTGIYMLLPVTTGKGTQRYEKMLVLVYGKARLLRMARSSTDVHYVFINDTFYQVLKNNLMQSVWPAMMQCPKFATTYGGIPLEEIGSWYKDLNPRRLSEAIYYYNRHCD